MLRIKNGIEMFYILVEYLKANIKEISKKQSKRKRQKIEEKKKEKQSNTYLIGIPETTGKWKGRNQERNMIRYLFFPPF